MKPIKMLSLQKWTKKVEDMIFKYGVTAKYIAAELRYEHHCTLQTPVKYMYSLYIAEVITPTISGSDWKLVLKEAEIVLKKKGYKKMTVASAPAEQNCNC